jgi:UDP-N-acetylmuramate dehydrogenase
MQILENVPLAPLTTLQVGGPARYFCEAHSENDVVEVLRFVRGRDLPLFVLGGGSNLVVADSGFSGFVLKIAIVDKSFDQDGPHLRFDLGAGLDWDDFAAESVARNCSGIECLSGIPGKVGATPVQNVGAYGQEVSETIEIVRAFDVQSGHIVELSNRECRFEYRSSIFNTSQRGRYVILRVRFRLTSGGVPRVKYADLQRYFSDRNSAPSLAAVREAVLHVRQSKGMLIIPGDENSRSAGSFFKNPVLGEKQFQQLNLRAQSRGLKVPDYPALSAQHKISAAWLVENSGFSKGYKQGEAAISTKHALALVNPGHATAAGILRLKSEIQQKVEDIWGIVLEPEPVLLGF